jgi:hypothetical protein
MSRYRIVAPTLLVAIVFGLPSVVATVPTMRGGKTIAVEPVKHVAYVFTPEYGPPPAAPLPAAAGRGPRGPVIGAWLFAISH